ncbi:MAG TPA: transporter substrate-binding domain-containing protein [Candidatus Paceibacterota bacterium]|nr:transporter substrate-binding domain-containing protein [Candidatus Paceibacterota bacterium]
MKVKPILLMAGFLSAVSFFVLPLTSFALDSEILTKEQNDFLTKTNRVIIVRPEKNYPPFVFGNSSRVSGLGVDYLELISKKTNTKLQYFEPTNLDSILGSIKEGKEGVVIAVTKTPERQDFLAFTKPFMTVPAVIVVRKDSKVHDIDLSYFSGKAVAVGKSYAVESYIKNNYPKVILDPVSDDEVVLQKLLLGEVDGAVMDLASLSYYTSSDALSYVQVAGETGFDYNLSFAVPVKNQNLLSILDSGLASINPQEKMTLRDKWITFKNQDSLYDTKEKKGFLNNTLKIMLLVVALLIIMFIFGATIFIRSFKKVQTTLIQSLRGLNKKNSSLEQDLKELEASKSVISKELNHIEELEEDLRSKIKEEEL